MSEQQNLQTVESIYDAFGRGDVEAILGCLADDVDWATDTDSTGAPWYGVRRDKDGVARFFSDLADAIDVSEFALDSIAAAGEDVHAVLRFGFSAQESGRRAMMHLHHFWRFRDGKVVYYRGSEDTAITERTLAP